MATIEKIGVQPGGAVSTEAAESDDTVERTYIVHFDSVIDEVEVRNTTDPDLPQIDDLHPSDSTLVVVDRRISNLDDSLKAWQIDVSYAPLTTDIPQGSIDPTEREWTVDFNSTDAREAWFKDVDGTFALNSAGQPFDPLPTRHAADWEMVIEVNQATFDLTTALARINTTNNAAFTVTDGVDQWVIGQHEGLLVGINPGRVQRENNVQYYRVQYRIKLDPDLWRPIKFDDVGVMVKDGGGNLVPAIDGAGGDIREGVPLDGAGNANIGGDPAELSFNPYDQSDFTEIPYEK